MLPLVTVEYISSYPEQCISLTRRLTPSISIPFNWRPQKELSSRFRSRSILTVSLLEKIVMIQPPLNPVFGIPCQLGVRVIVTFVTLQFHRALITSNPALLLKSLPQGVRTGNTLSGRKTE